MENWKAGDRGNLSWMHHCIGKKRGVSVRIAFTDSIACDTFLWNLSRLSHDFSFLTQFDFSPPHLLICLGFFQIQLTRNHFSSKTPSLPLGSSLLWDPLLHTLLTLLSYLLLSLCTECDCISQGLNCPQVPETICWQIWLAFMTLSPLVGIPDSLRNIAISQRAWGISEGREGQGQLLNFIPRQFEKSLVKAKNDFWFDTQQQVIVVASISLEATYGKSSHQRTSVNSDFAWSSEASSIQGKTAEMED